MDEVTQPSCCDTFRRWIFHPRTLLSLPSFLVILSLFSLIFYGIALGVGLIYYKTNLCISPWSDCAGYGYLSFLGFLLFIVIVTCRCKDLVYNFWRIRDEMASDNLARGGGYTRV